MRGGAVEGCMSRTRGDGVPLSCGVWSPLKWRSALRLRLLLLLGLLAAGCGGGVLGAAGHGAGGVVERGDSGRLTGGPLTEEHPSGRKAVRGSRGDGAVAPRGSLRVPFLEDASWPGLPQRGQTRAVLGGLGLGLEGGAGVGLTGEVFCLDGCVAGLS